MGTNTRIPVLPETDFRDLDEEARTAILSVADAVSAVAGHPAGDARRAAVRANVGSSWKQGHRLPLDLVNAGFDAACI